MISALTTVAIREGGAHLGVNKKGDETNKIKMECSSRVLLVNVKNVNVAGVMLYKNQDSKILLIG